MRGMALAVDAGSGYVPYARTLYDSAMYRSMVTLFTHYHEDHIIGVPIAPTTFRSDIRKTFIGPREVGFGVEEMHRLIMHRPIFPIDARDVRSHHEYRDIEAADAFIIAFHSLGGMTLVERAVWEVAETEGMLSFGEKKVSISECLIVKMWRTNHPEETFSYRFEERSTGRVFVFMTDHENTPEISPSLHAHIEGSHALVIDAQYSRSSYETRTRGWGHGTPDYAVRLARIAGAAQLGLTHHDPFSTDEDIDAILAEGKSESQGMNMSIFACHDGQIIDV